MRGCALLVEALLAHCAVYTRGMTWVQIALIAKLEITVWLVLLTNKKIYEVSARRRAERSKLLVSLAMEYPAQKGGSSELRTGLIRGAW